MRAGAVPPSVWSPLQTLDPASRGRLQEVDEPLRPKFDRETGLSSGSTRPASMSIRLTPGGMPVRRILFAAAETTIETVHRVCDPKQCLRGTQQRMSRTWQDKQDSNESRYRGHRRIGTSKLRESIQTPRRPCQTPRRGPCTGPCCRRSPPTRTRSRLDQIPLRTRQSAIRTPFGWPQPRWFPRPRNHRCTSQQCSRCHTDTG